MNDDTMPALPATPGALGVGYSEAQMHAHAIKYASQMTARLRAELATAREDERERCAKICDEMPMLKNGFAMTNPDDCAKAIRATQTIGVQACRPEDRAMLATPEGAELVGKVAAAMNKSDGDTLYRHGGRPMTLRECMDAEDGGE
jgi:hypothetical protein